MQFHLSIGKCVLMAVSAFAFTTALNAQPPKEEVSKLIESKNYVFHAQQAIPQGGRTRQLTSEYDVQVKRDTLISFLPYFGRSFTAPADPSKGGIDFTSTDFQYTQTPTKKNGWTINIKPNATDVQEMILSVSESGYGTLTVRSNNRQAINFYGFVDHPREIKKKE